MQSLTLLGILPGDIRSREQCVGDKGFQNNPSERDLLKMVAHLKTGGGSGTLDFIRKPSSAGFPWAEQQECPCKMLHQKLNSTSCGNPKDITSISQQWWLVTEIEEKITSWQTSGSCQWLLLGTPPQILCSAESWSEKAGRKRSWWFAHLQYWCDDDDENDRGKVEERRRTKVNIVNFCQNHLEFIPLKYKKNLVKIFNTKKGNRWLGPEKG